MSVSDGSDSNTTGERGVLDVDHAELAPVGEHRGGERYNAQG